MKKYILDLKVRACEHLRERYVLLKLTDDNPLPEMLPGQFAELKINGSETTFLRRPISINNVVSEDNEVWFLVHVVGDGTKRLAELKEGDTLNVVMPLGNGFTMPDKSSDRYLLVGGGVGIAPLLYMGKKMNESGCRPAFLLGGRTKNDLMQLDLFRQYGEVYITTEDGSDGEQGFVTQHSILSNSHFDHIATCGPKPMMMAIARYAKNNGISCEASLENMMACGVGACLCCVENTTEGHLCVCKEGPVFNINKLLWQI